MSEYIPSGESKGIGRPAAIAVAALGYFLLAAVTIHLTSNGRNPATMWPADAVILALLINQPRRDWSFILLAGWAANLLANSVTRGWAPGLIFYGGINMAGACLAARMIARSIGTDNLLANPATVLRFVTYAGVVAPALSAVAGSLVSLFIYGEPFGASFIRWYLSNALGLLVVTPFLKSLFDGSYTRCFAHRDWKGRAEAAALHVTHGAVTYHVFNQSTLPLLFLPVTTMLLLSFRLGGLGTKLGIVTIAIIGSAATLQGHGPIMLVQEAADFQEFFLQFYLAILLATTLPVAATVAERAAALEYLAEREEALRLIMTHSPDGILSFDAWGICRWANGPLHTYLGIPTDALLGAHIRDICAPLPDDVARLLHDYGNNSGNSHAVEFAPALRPHLTLEGSIGVLRRDDAAIGLVMTLRDITGRKAQERAIMTKAETDDLTGVLNRSGFRKHLVSAIGDSSRPTSLALIDVDRFKSINDEHGHAIGDLVLTEIARRMTNAIRECDFVGRLGGDEFAILFRCDLATAEQACRRLAVSIRQSPVYTGEILSVIASISCGIAEYRPGLTRDEVFDAADAALYEVKRSGRNGVRVAA